MPTRRNVVRGLLGFAAAASLGNAAEKYTGPVPQKHDVPYLMHADNLIETESVAATQAASKGDTVFAVAGVTSPARTPLAEPIFLFVSDRIAPASLGLYQFEIKKRPARDCDSEEERQWESIPHLDPKSFRRCCFGLRLRSTWRTENIVYRRKARISRSVLRFTRGSSG